MKVSASLSFLWALLPAAVRGASAPTENEPDYLIVGAGGAGLQMALYLEKFGASYKILEKKDHVASHFKKFPQFDELISVNKIHDNETLQMRYDWHTLLEAPLTMRDVTTEYFPNGVDWHKYMSLVAEKAGILPKIEFNVNVERVVEGKPCLMLSDGSKRCAKKRIFMGTGLQEKKEPLLEALGGIPYSKVTKEMADRRQVCILGNGNSGYETAQNLFKKAKHVVVHGRHSARLSSVTRYTGDVRIKYLQVMENFNMKVLDTSFVQMGDPFPPETIESVRRRYQWNSKQIDLWVGAAEAVTWLRHNKCETFVIATGFDSTVPDGLPKGPRFPISEDWYQPPNNPFIHYIGYLMHERDFRKSAGGFLSGFRYLVRNLAYHVREVDMGIPYPYKVFMSKEAVVAHGVARIQTADDFFILQDGIAVRDMVVPDLKQPGKYYYYEGITHEFHKDFMDRKDVISVYLGWGDGRTASAVFDTNIHYDDTKRLRNALLHPVIEVNGKIRASVEDLALEWIGPHGAAVERTIRAALNGDLRRFIPKPPFKHYGYVINNQTDPDEYELPLVTKRKEVEKLNAELEKISQYLFKAAATLGAEVDVKALQEEMKRLQPALYEIQTMVKDDPGMAPSCEEGSMLTME